MRVLLVSHEASRSGAPRVAAMVARQLRELGHRVEVVCRYRGPLLTEFQEAAPTTVEVLPRVRNRLRRTAGLRTVGRLLEVATATVTLLRHHPELVYVNSSAAAAYLRPAGWLHLPLVLHVHESASVAEPFLASAWATGRLGEVALVACSPSVHTDLVALVRDAPERVHLLASVPDEHDARRLAALPVELPYRADEIVVGACGTVEHRKGADLLEEAAHRVPRETKGRRIRFVWVGDPARSDLEGPGDERERRDRTDEQEGGAPGDRVEMLGPAVNPYVHLRRFDVLALPSRDDPFPLVVLEAMLLGTPVIGFDVGGVAQQVGDTGLLVPAEDVDAFARAVSRLVEDDDERRRLGEAARARVDERFSSAAFGRQLRTVLDAASAAA